MDCSSCIFIRCLLILLIARIIHFIDDWKLDHLLHLDTCSDALELWTRRGNAWLSRCLWRRIDSGSGRYYQDVSTVGLFAILTNVFMKWRKPCCMSRRIGLQFPASYMKGYLELDGSYLTSNFCEEHCARRKGRVLIPNLLNSSQQLRCRGTREDGVFTWL